MKAIPGNHANRATVREDIRRCATGLALQYKTPRAIVENLGTTVNTPYDEYAPIMSPNFTDRIYFSAVRPGNVGGARNNFGQPDEVMGRHYSDIFTSQVNKGIWTPPQAMHHLLNSPKHEVLLDFNANGKALFYFKGSSYTQGEILIDTFRVGSRTLSSDPFLGPVEATAGLSSAQFIGDSMVIFASQRPGGYGGLDLYKTVFIRGRWSAPINLGPDINSAFDETTPFLSRNGQVLYFSSNRPDHSIGGFDVFRCLLIPQINRWTNPDNLGMPVNSASDDTHFRLSRDGYTAYFASSRKDGMGERDIYAAYFFDYLHEMAAPIVTPAPVYVQTPPPPRQRTNPDGSLADPEAVDVAPRGTSIALKPFYFNQDGQWMQGAELKQLDELVAVLKKHPQLNLLITAASRQELAVSSRLYGGIKSAENMANYLIGKGVSPVALQLRSVPPPPDFTSNFKTLNFQLSSVTEMPLSSTTEPWLSGYTEESGLIFRIQIGQSSSVLQSPLLSQDKYAMSEKSLSNGGLFVH
ncbi:MAG: PD40 domain-containing protein, partial [Haliscomenobacter sp.]|nr:PD40 domain-containing protein [Haliscomenobacter sp.]